MKWKALLVCIGVVVVGQLVAAAADEPARSVAQLVTGLGFVGILFVAAFVHAGPRRNEASSSSSTSSTSSAASAIGSATLADWQRWAIVAGGIVTLRNKQPLDSLRGRSMNNRAWHSASLERWWKVRNREDVIPLLARLYVGMHSPIFDAELLRVQGRPPEELARIRASRDEEQRAQFDFVLSVKDRTSAGAAVAFDLCRVITLVRQAYHAEFLDESEVWHWSLYAARALRRAYDSWEALFAAYMLGYQFWHNGKTDDAEVDSYHWLLHDPSSPIHTLPWRTELPEVPYRENDRSASTRATPPAPAAQTG